LAGHKRLPHPSPLLKEREFRYRCPSLKEKGLGDEVVSGVSAPYDYSILELHQQNRYYRVISSDIYASLFGIVLKQG